MSVENHRHCQATVLGATGEPYGNGLTWNVINNGNFPNLDAIYSGWRNELFSRNDNMTQDLAGILTLINQLAKPISFPTFDDGDLISVKTNTDGSIVIKVKNDFSSGYQGVVGVKGSGKNMRLTESRVQVENVNEDGPVIATLTVGDDVFYIRALSEEQPPEPGEYDRYVITEDRVYDIILSGGEDDGLFLDYYEDESPQQDRYVITEDRVYDIVLSGGADDGLFLDYSEDESPDPQQDRYIITENRQFDIILSGGQNNNCPLDYTDETRYVVTENGHDFDIGVSGYGDSTLLNYNEN